MTNNYRATIYHDLRAELEQGKHTLESLEGELRISCRGMGHIGFPRGHESIYRAKAQLVEDIRTGVVFI